MFNCCNCVLLLLLSFQVSVGQYRDGITTKVINDAQVGKDYSDFYVNATVEYLFAFRSLQLKVSDTRPSRVTVECLNATRKHPVLVVLRQAKGVLSWQLPLVVPSKNDKAEFKRTSRTLCPNKNYQMFGNLKSTSSNSKSLVLQDEEMNEEVTIIISSSSPENLRFLLRLDIVEDFSVSISENRSLIVSPSEPRFYEYKWSGELSSPDTVVLQVDSDSDICMVVSIQNISCPVFDLERTVQFEGYRQTVTKLGGITLTKSVFPEGFYIVFVVKGDDTDCSENPLEISVRSKHVTFSFNPSISYEDFLKALVSALFLYLSIYVIAILFSVVYYLRKRSSPELNPDLLTASQVQAEVNAGRSSVYSIDTQSHIERSMHSTSQQNTSHHGAIDGDDSSLDDPDIDSLCDASFDKDVIRSKRVLYVCDLARKNTVVLRKKSLLYFWNLLTVATFYGLPVIQLVISSQMVLKETGNQDLCYYNFLCAYPLGFLSDFNHVYSNIGYVMLGLLFVSLVFRRDRMHLNAIAIRMDLDRFYGIPQHYGLLYAMGAALIMEGVLSGCYHVCPNHSNFQFDTSFMYVIALLCMLKIYHTRHPDINASAYASFGVLALIILVGVAGIIAGTLHFFIAFTVLHLSMCLWLSGKVYYMGRLKLDLVIIRRVWFISRSEITRDPCAFFRPKYPSRMVLLILGNMANWAIVAVGWIYHLDRNFGTYLLAIFMANLMLYTIFYIVMKFLCSERLLCQPLAYLVLATVGWGFSLYFFLHKSISWAVTPAVSRNFNTPCKIMNFYDRHDIWHFLSAFSMFFSFMTLLTLDDDLEHVPRSQIHVF